MCCIGSTCYRFTTFRIVPSLDATPIDQMLPLAMAMQPEQLHDHDSPHNHANRWKMTPENKLRLQQAFDEMPYPSRETKIQLANELGVRREQVAKWFQHRREALSKLGQFQGQAMRARRTEEERQILQGMHLFLSPHFILLFATLTEKK